MRGVQRGITTTFIVLVILAGTIAITAVYLNYFQNQKQKTSEINSFEDCAKLYPVMESYPEQCNTPDGKHFTNQKAEVRASVGYEGEIFKSDFYEFKYPSGFKPESGAHGCNPIIVRPQLGQPKGSICVIESDKEDSLVNIGPDEKLQTKEDLVVGKRKAVIYETERITYPSLERVTTIKLVIENIPFVIGYGSGKTEKKIGDLAFWYTLEDKSDSVKAGQILREILGSFKVSE